MNAYKSSPNNATFLIGPARCGSYALSKMMNNRNCFAHHEGKDLETFADKDVRELWFFDKMFNVLKSGRHYFNCDVSCAPKILRDIINLSGPMAYVMFQIVYIELDVEFVLQSFNKMGIQTNESFAHRYIKEARDFVDHCESRGMRVLRINKNEGEEYNGHMFFTNSQLTEIAIFVGAVENTVDPEYKRIMQMADQPMSLTADVIKKYAAEAKAHHQSKFTKGISIEDILKIVFPEAKVEKVDLTLPKGVSIEDMVQLSEALSDLDDLDDEAKDDNYGHDKRSMN